MAQKLHCLLVIQTAYNHWLERQARHQAELERELLLAGLNAYANSVAHDLKQPIPVIYVLSDMLKMASLTEDEAEMVRDIMNTSLKMSSIIDDMLFALLSIMLQCLNRTIFDRS